METQIIENPIKKQSRWLKWLLIVGTVIILNFFFNSVIKVVYNEPKFESFCENKQVNIISETKEECVADGGQWTEDNQFIQKRLLVAEPISVPAVEQARVGYCNPNYICGQDYNDAMEIYERNVFIAWVIFGALAIIAGFFLKFEVISLSLSLGGVLSLIIGSVRYWSRMDDVLQLVVLGVTLTALIWVGIKKIRE